MNKSYVLLRMYDALRSGAGIKLTDCCGKYEISVATLRRYIAFLRDMRPRNRVRRAGSRLSAEKVNFAGSDAGKKSAPRRSLCSAGQAEAPLLVARPGCAQGQFIQFCGCGNQIRGRGCKKYGAVGEKGGFCALFLFAGRRLWLPLQGAAAEFCCRCRAFRRVQRQ